jgi:hypothetical protein
MPSILDNFLSQARTQSNAVIGTESIVLTGNITISGVWSSVMINAESSFGGEQIMADSSVIVPSASNVNKALIGKRGTYAGMTLRVIKVDTGTNESTVYFENETKALTL